jgi:hypothetical protein
MPYEVVWEPKGVVKHLTGKVCVEEFMQSISVLQNDPRFDRVSYSIDDFIGTQELQVTESDMHMYAAMSIGAAVTNPNIHRCILATDPDIVALVDAYIQLSPHKTVVLDSISEARAWLTAQGISQPVN